MNKGSKIAYVCLFLGVSFFNQSFAAQSLAAQNQGVNFSDVADVFYSALKTVKNLNYYTDEKVVFVVAGQEVTFDVGAGHGNLFVPLVPVYAKLSSISIGFGENDSDKISFPGFTKVFIENEIYKNGKDVEILKWLIDFKLNSIQLFTFKFLSLLNTVRVDGDYARMLEEAFCLLFRLSQVNDLDLIDKSKRLSALLPESLVNVLKDNKFGLIDFVDDLWTVLMSDEVAAQVKPVQPRAAQIKGFVFKDEVMAKRVYEKFKDCAVSDLREQVNVFVKPHGYGIVDIADNYNDFMKFRSDIFGKDFSQNKFAKTLVGYDKFILTQNTDKPASLISQIQSLSTKSGLVMAADDVHGEYWVAYVSDDMSDDMSIINVLKESLLIIAESFKEYLQVKKSIFIGSDDESLRYKAAFDAKEKSKIALEKYVRSDEGCLVFDQIKREIELLVDSDVKDSQVAQSVQDTISVLESELSKLENQKTDRTKDLTKWQQILALQYGKNVNDVKVKVDQIKSEISKIDIQLSDKQDEISSAKAKLGGNENKTDASAVEKDRHKLAQLYKILEDKQKSGGVPSDKLLNAIKIIEDRITKAHSEQPVVKVSVDEKLVVREAVANLLDAKAAELKNQESSKLKELDLIEDIEDKVIQELLLDDVVHMQKTFVKQLEATAAQIREDNFKAKKLEAYRKAFACVDSGKISPDKLAQITTLELRVGHILDSEKHEDFVSKIMLRDSFVSEFIQDLTLNSDKFMCVKQRLQNSLAQVINNSSHFKNNAKLYRYFWRTMPVTWKLFLSCAGVSEQTFC